MIVQVHSVGSLWQESRRRAVFNSTGIDIAGVQRSRAKIFGQVRFPPAELQQALATGPLQGTNWNATPLREHRGIRKLHLMKRAGRRHAPELFLMTVSDETCGRLDAQSWSNDLAQLVSWSESGARQELLFLMKPFAYLRGVTGAAVLTPQNGCVHWTITRW